MITNINDLEDVLEKLCCYDRSVMRGYENNEIKLVICPILDTQYSDIYILINNNNSKWRCPKTIQQLLLTFKQDNVLYYRAFVLSTAQDDMAAGDALPIWIFSKEHRDEKYILHVLNITNIWDKYDE